MNLDYDATLGKKEQYVSTYVQFGKESQTISDAVSKEDAEEQFNKNFNSTYYLIKTQVVDEWIKETSNAIVQGIMKRRKKDIGNLTSKIDYNSRSYFRDLKKMREKANKTSEMSIPNHEKKFTSFNV